MVQFTGQDRDGHQSSDSIRFGNIEAMKTAVEKVCACGNKYLTHFPGTSKMCFECADKEKAHWKADEESKRREISEERQRRNIWRARIPEQWRDITFSTPFDPEVLKRIDPRQLAALDKAKLFAEEYALNFSRKSRSLLIYGKDVGVGKTHICACIANYLLYEKRARVLFKEARDFLLELRASFNSSDSSESDILDELYDCDLLILDDVGRNNCTDWVENTYWSIFNRCLNDRIPVVVTTNKPVQAIPKVDCLEARIGMAAYSRLLSMCGQGVIELDGEDLR